MAATKLSRTSSSTGNRKTWTWSGWVKRFAIDKGGLFATYTDTNNRLDFGIDANQRFFFKEKEGSGSTLIDFTTNRLFRDIASWYHIVLAVDTTQATESDRVKIYVNGEQITSWLDSTYPDQNRDTLMNVSGRTYTLGTTDGSSNYWNGLMSSVILVDGTAYPASTFGSTNSTSGEWIPNSSPSVTYGTNGYKLNFEDAVLGDDTSGNTNDFTMSGSGTPTLDCPSNTFPTFNNLIRQASTNNLNLDQGNLYSGGNGANAWRSAFMTLAAKTGKYYCEMKCVGTDGSSQNYGVSDVNQFNTGPASGFDFSSQSRGYGLNPNGNKVNNGGAVSTGSTYTTNDIVGMALDLDNGKIYYSKNGTYYLSGDPTSGSTGTGSFFDIAAGYIYSPTVAIYGAADNMAFNFGNGYFRTVAVSSAGTPGSTVGVFEYDVPTGYQPWSTKGINV